MGSNLTGSKIKNTYTGLLKTSDNSTLSASGVKAVSDGAGNDSPLNLSQSEVGVGDYLFPSLDGTSNQIMITDGSGTLSFIDNVSASLVTVTVSTTPSVNLSDSFMYVFNGSADASWNLPAGTDGRTFRVANATSAYKITLSPNGAETILNSDPFVIYAGTTYDFTYISSLSKWIAK